MTSTDERGSGQPARATGAFRGRRAPAGDGVCVVGLVGRAGGGKSTVARALAAEGARVFEADRIGHEITDRDPEVRAALMAEYGQAVYRADGGLDRPAVAARVFADAGALARLNALVHPRILARLRDAVRALVTGGFQGVVVLDAALLLDWHLERSCDVLLAVVAPEPARIGRLTASRGWSDDEARRRLAAQRPDAFFVDAADHVLRSDGTPEALAAEARAAVARLCAPCLVRRP